MKDFKLISESWKRFMNESSFNRRAPLAFDDPAKSAVKFYKSMVDTHPGSYYATGYHPLNDWPKLDPNYVNNSASVAIFHEPEKTEDLLRIAALIKEQLKSREVIVHYNHFSSKDMDISPFREKHNIPDDVGRSELIMLVFTKKRFGSSFAGDEITP